MGGRNDREEIHVGKPMSGNPCREGDVDWVVWSAQVNMPSGRKSAARTCRRCACGAVEQHGLRVFIERPAYITLLAKYGSNLSRGFQGRSMRTILMTEASQPTLANFVSATWETSVLRRTTLSN